MQVCTIQNYTNRDDFEKVVGCCTESARAKFTKEVAIISKLAFLISLTYWSSFQKVLSFVAATRNIFVVFALLPYFLQKKSAC